MFRRLLGFLFFLVTLGAIAGAVIATGFAAISGPNRWIVIGATAAILVGFGLAARRMFGRTWAPVADLIDATRRLGEGDSGVRIKARARGPFSAVASSFNRMAERLEDEDSRRRRLLADLGHEMRTPLTVIRGEIEAVLDGLHEPGNLSNVIDEVELMERLLEDLRVLSLTEAGQLQLQKELTDLTALIGDVVSSFSAVAERSQVEVAVSVDGELPEIRVDPHRLHQILSNLVSNAIHQMPGGGALTIVASPEPGAVSVEVSDTGPGIHHERLSTIFERFNKARDSIGLGLGLSIARDLVVAHGGTITAANRAGGGALFTVRIPSQ